MTKWLTQKSYQLAQHENPTKLYGGNTHALTMACVVVFSVCFDKV